LTIHTLFSEVENVSGHILPHEHIFCDFTPITGDLDHLLNDKVVALRELSYFEQVGGSVIVDITPPDLGRQPKLLAEIAHKTNLKIVMSTGWYRKAFYPKEIDTLSSSRLAQIVISELTHGIELENGEIVKAGIIGEIGVDRDIVSAQEERVLRAAAIASCETGAPISTHSSMYPVGIKQLEILKEYPIAPNKIVVGHADTYLDEGYHKELLDAGCYIQFDTIGRNHMNSDADRVSSILNLVELGYQDQILLSTDRCFRSDLKTFGGLGYDYLFVTFKELLMNAGLPEEIFTIFTNKNAIAALSW
jgi:phosphotriesterase-related protein